MATCEKQFSLAEFYFEHPAHNATNLKKFRKSPREFEAERLLGQIVPEEKRCLDVGTAIHYLAIEPEKFDSLVIEIPDDVLTKPKPGSSATPARRGNAWDQFEKENEGKVMLSHSEMWRVHQAAKSIIHTLGGRPGDQQDVLIEHPIFWTAPILMGIECKALLDLFFRGKGLLLDIKTTEDVLPDVFSKVARTLQYGLQRHHYIEGATAVYGFEPKWKWLVGSTKPPFRSRFYTASQKSRKYWANEWPKTLRAIEEARLTGDYRDPHEDEDMEIDV